MLRCNVHAGPHGRGRAACRAGGDGTVTAAVAVAVWTLVSTMSCAAATFGAASSASSLGTRTAQASAAAGGDCTDDTTLAALMVTLSAEVATVRAENAALRERVETLATDNKALLQASAALQVRVDALTESNASFKSKLTAHSEQLAEQRGVSAAFADRIATTAAALSVSIAGDASASPVRASAVHHPAPTDVAPASSEPFEGAPRSPVSTKGNHRDRAPSRHRALAEAPSEEPIELAADEAVGHASLHLNMANAEIRVGPNIELVTSGDGPSGLSLLVDGDEAARLWSGGVEPSATTFTVNGGSESHLFHPVAIQQPLASWRVGDPARVSVTCVGMDDAGNATVVLESGVFAFRGRDGGTDSELSDSAGLSFVMAERVHVADSSNTSSTRCFGGWEVSPDHISRSMLLFVKGTATLQYVLRPLGGGARLRDVTATATTDAALGTDVAVAPAVEAIALSHQRAEALAATGASTAITLRALLEGARVVPGGAADEVVTFEEDVVELSAAATVGGLQAGTVQAGDELGHWGNSIDTLGADLDGNGVNDAVVGLPADDDAGTDRGSVVVLFMEATGAVLGQQKISDGIGLVGDASLALNNGDSLGNGVCGMADFDGDGWPEVAVGAPQHDDGGADVGAVWVLFLTPEGTARATLKISQTTTDPPLPLDPGDRIGEHAMAALPDVDGDGRQELAVGSYGDDDGGTDRGALYIVFLRASGDAAVFHGFTKISDSSDAGWRSIDGHNSMFFSSGGVACMGDVSGDGYVDLAVGAADDNDGGPNGDYGAVYMLALSPEAGDGSVARYTKVSRRNGLEDLGLSFSSSWYWGRISRAGDLDRDGVEELLAGAGQWNIVDVLFFRRDGSMTVRAAVRLSKDHESPLPAWMKTRMGSDGYWGSSTGFLGDLNGNGTPTIAVGAIWDDTAGQVNSGAVFIMEVSEPRTWWEVQLRLPALPPGYVSGAAARDDGLLSGQLYRQGSAAGVELWPGDLHVVP